MSAYFPEPKSSGERLKVESDLIMQQKQIYKMQQVLIHQTFLKRLI